MLLLTIKDNIIDELSKSFDSALRPRERITVVADIEMFTKEDKYIWEQGKGKTSLCFQVFFDGVFISLIHEDQPIQRAVLDFWRGFKEAYTQKKIRLIPQEYVIEQEIKKEEQKLKKESIDRLPESTPVERQAKHIIKNLVKEANGKPA